MAALGDRPASEGRGLRPSRFIRVDEREMKRTFRELIAEVQLNPPERPLSGHRNATARNANSATVMATLLIVCS